MKDRFARIRAALIWIIAAAALTGCSRSAINYQIAESIGTVGLYENNEPVESPQMKAEREQKEIAESEESQFQEQLDEAKALADGYFYEEAVKYLEQIEPMENTRERLTQMIDTYTSAQEALTPYEGDVTHLCFPILIEDSGRAFDGDDYSYNYASTMITTREFKGILESLYANGYILVDIADVAAKTTDARGITIMEKCPLKLPAGKKPVIVSQDNLNYASIRNGDGIATALTLEEGEVKARYTDEEGHDLNGDYDLIPILNSFVREHPDFSWRGAKGIVSVSGSEGVFGYNLESTLGNNAQQNKDTVSQIAQALTSDGWKIACAGYKHAYMNEMSTEQLESDIDDWFSQVGELTGGTNILFYPYGGEVEYPSAQLTSLLDKGFEYLCGLWTDQDFLEVNEDYTRQTRRFVDGYTLEYAPNYFTSFFSASSVIDPDR